MQISVGDTYFYNNRKVEILKIETEQFVLVCGEKDLHSDISGQEFCEACQIGGGPNIPPLTHKCGDVDEIIDEVFESLSDKSIFWVDIKHLQKEPFEYKRWKKISNITKELCKEISGLERKKKEIEESTKEAEKEREYCFKEVQAVKNELESLKKECLKATRIIENKEELVYFDNSKVKMSIGRIVSYMKDSIKLEYLERGGLDNWEWYSESLPKCEDVDEYLENEAMERLF